jgi:hypothetical protein
MEKKKVNYELGKMWKWVCPSICMGNHHKKKLPLQPGSVPRLKSQVFWTWNTVQPLIYDTVSITISKIKTSLQVLININVQYVVCTEDTGICAKHPLYFYGCNQCLPQTIYCAATEDPDLNTLISGYISI